MNSSMARTGTCFGFGDAFTFQKKIFLGENVHGGPFLSRKVFEGVHSHVMDLLSKSDFGQFFNNSNFRFGPDSYFKISIIEIGPKSEVRNVRTI